MPSRKIEPQGAGSQFQKDGRSLRLAFLALHSSPLAPPGSGDNGGMTTYLLGLGAALGQAGHRVDIYTASASEAAHRQPAGHPAPGLRIYPLAFSRLGEDRLASYRYRSNLALFLARRWRRAGLCYDAVFSHYWLSAAVGHELARLLGLPHLVMFHTLARAKNEACPEEREPALRLAEEERLARSAYRVVVASKSEGERVRAYFGLDLSRILQLECGVDGSLFRPLDKTASQRRLGLGLGPLVLALGRLEPVKGFNLLPEIAALVPAERGVVFCLAGGERPGSRMLNHLRFSLKRLGLGDRFILRGSLPHEDLPHWYGAASAVVIPSHYESLSFVALEALACARPLVAAPVGIVPELLGRPETAACGEIVTGRSPSTWAAALQRVLDSPAGPGPAAVEAALASCRWEQGASTLAELLLCRERRAIINKFPPWVGRFAHGRGITRGR